MPNPRRAIQEAHERYNVGLLVNALNRRHRASFKVISEPNPPEAIIQSGRTTRWVEVVTAFWNAEFARDVYSYATEGEEHKSVGNGLFMNMDQEFSENFASVVQSKLEKKTYELVRDRYGPGYLLVSVQFPFFSAETRKYMREAWQKRSVNDRGCFKSIYLAYRGSFQGYKVTQWRLS